MGKHIKFDLNWAPFNNIKQEHPQKIMEKLGIVYQHSTPESIADCWIFWNCENVPIELPPYIEIVNYNPIKFIGFGLDKKTAKKIIDYKNK